MSGFSRIVFGLCLLTLFGIVQPQDLEPSGRETDAGSSMRDSISALRSDIHKLAAAVIASQEKYQAFNESLNVSNKAHLRELDSLAAAFSDTLSTVSGKIDGMAARLESRYDAVRKQVNTGHILIASIFLVAVIGVIIGFHRLQGQIVSQNVDIGTKVNDISPIMNGLATQPNEVKGSALSTPEEIDHSFPIRVGEEIYRMRLRLSNMDTNVVGVTALTNALTRLESDFNGKGYLIEDLTGQQYNEGLTAIVKVWERHQNIERGKEDILRMIKPRISHCGTVVYPGEIVVGIRGEDIDSVNDGGHDDTV